MAIVHMEYLDTVFVLAIDQIHVIVFAVCMVGLHIIEMVVFNYEQSIMISFLHKHVSIVSSDKVGHLGEPSSSNVKCGVSGYNHPKCAIVSL